MTAAAAEAAPHLAQVSVRLATDADMAFFYKSMLNTLYFDSDARKIPRPAFLAGHTKRIDACLARPTTKLVIACLADDPATILGFLLAEPKTVHFVYCKAPFRGMGIARGLFNALGLSLKEATVTHMTNQISRGLFQKGLEVTYDPYRF